MQWIFRDFQELNPAVYYFCLFIFFKKNTIKNLKLHLVKYYKKSNSKQNKLKQPKLHGAWSSDGKILIKDLSGKIHKISSIQELEPYKAVRAASDETALKK